MLLEVTSYQLPHLKNKLVFQTKLIGITNYTISLNKPNMPLVQKCWCGTYQGKSHNKLFKMICTCAKKAIGDTNKELTEWSLALGRRVE